MKKVFSLLCMALVAGVMFTSCKDDENTLGEVKFGSEKWDVVAANGTSYTHYDEIQAGFFADSVSRYPWVYLDAATSVETYKGNFDTATWEYGTDAILALYYYSSASEVLTLQYEDGTEYTVGDWWAKTVDYTVSAFDATGATISFNLAADMFKFADEYTALNGIDIDNVATTKLKMDVKDASVTADNNDYGKAMFNKVARPNQLKGAKIVK